MTKYIDETTNIMVKPDAPWQPVAVPDLTALPRPVFVRATQLPPKSYFAPHQHNWDQLVYASAGVLVVETQNNRFVIPSEQAVWLPAGAEHTTSTTSGAVFRSLYIDPELSHTKKLSGPCRVLAATHLVRELIHKVASFPPAYDEDGYPSRVIDVLLEELSTLNEVGMPLPWPQNPRLKSLCESLYQDPTDDRSMAQWGQELGVSSRTLARYLERETGLTFREWRHHLRIFKALEYLNQDHSVTTVALMLGYNSPSAFIAMFKKVYGQTPLQFIKRTQV